MAAEKAGLKVDCDWLSTATDCTSNFLLLQKSITAKYKLTS